MGFLTTEDTERNHKEMRFRPSSVVNIRLSGLAKRRARPFEDALEDKESISAAQQGVASAFWMGHEAEDIAVLIADSRDVVFRAVGVRRGRRAAAGVTVAKQDAAFEFEVMKDVVIREIATLAVSNRKLENGSRPCGIREWTVVAFNADVDVFANEVQSTISDQRARKQARFAKDLKTIADTDYDSAAGGKAPHRAHDR
jgi:hypothetical protein